MDKLLYKTSWLKYQSIYLAWRLCMFRTYKLNNNVLDIRMYLECKVSSTQNILLVVGLYIYVSSTQNILLVVGLYMLVVLKCATTFNLYYSYCSNKYKYYMNYICLIVLKCASSHSMYYSYCSIKYIYYINYICLIVLKIL